MVVGRHSGRPKMHRRVATKWNVKRLQEAVQCWTPEGAKRWRKWMARLNQWVKIDLLRLQQKKLCEQLWESRLENECLISRANEALVKFNEFLGRV